MKSLGGFALLLVLFIPWNTVMGVELNWLGHWKDEDKRETLVREI